jgi:hypothetical protein
MAIKVHPGGYVEGFGYVEETYEIDGIEVSREDYETALAQVQGPAFHESCGHFHLEGQPCPDTPCGSYLCCIN